MKRIITFLLGCLMAIAISSAQGLVTEFPRTFEADIYATNGQVTVYCTQYNNIFLKLDTFTGELWQFELANTGEYNQKTLINAPQNPKGTYVLLKTAFDGIYILFNGDNGELKELRFNPDPRLTTIKEFKENPFGT